MSAKHFAAKAVKPGFTGYDFETEPISPIVPKKSVKPPIKKEDTQKKENVAVAIAKLEVIATLNPNTPLEKIIIDIISLLKINL